MHPIIALSLILQIACAVHVVRSRRPLYWIFLLLVGSYVAIAIYIFAEVLPDLRHNRSARLALNQARDRIDPERRKRQASDRLEQADTLDNRCKLAEESLRSGDYQQAAELYRSGMKGLYVTDPNLMLGLAKAQFALEQPLEAKRTLDALIAANPDFRSSEGHLLYARSVEASGDVAAALHEYEAVVLGASGEEARVRYGLLLKRDGQLNKATEVFEEVLKRSRLAPDYYRREQREWIEIAKRETAQPG